MRGNFLKALDIHTDKLGLTIPEIMAEAMEEHGFFYVLDRMTKFIEHSSTVKVDGRVKHEHTHGRLSETDAFLEGVFARREEDAPEESSEERPLLPH